MGILKNKKGKRNDAIFVGAYMPPELVDYLELVSIKLGKSRTAVFIGTFTAMLKSSGGLDAATDEAGKSIIDKYKSQTDISKLAYVKMIKDELLQFKLSDDVLCSLFLKLNKWKAKRK